MYSDLQYKCHSFVDCYPYFSAILLDVINPLYFFFGLPLDRCPLPYPCSSRFGYRLLFMRATCPKYVNLRLCKRCTLSSLTPNSCLTSTLRRRSRLVMPHILLRTDISKTLSFRLCSSFKVHVSALYNTMAWAKVWYKRERK